MDYGFVLTALRSLGRLYLKSFLLVLLADHNLSLLLKPVASRATLYINSAVIY